MTQTSPISSNSHGLSDGAAEFLAEHGFADTPLNGFVADASPRRYFRLFGHDTFPMDDWQDPDGFEAYLLISWHLNRLDLSAPRVLQALPEQCLTLIEDFGDDTYARCLARGVDESELYELAMDALLKQHHDTQGGLIERPVYVMGVHLDELSILSHWFAPAVAPDLGVTAFDAQFRTLVQKALTPVADRQKTLVLRNLHVDNLMLLDQLHGAAKCGRLNFQDAIPGPSEYDLVSLLQDARRDLETRIKGKLLFRYCENAPESLVGADPIRRRYHILGAQRHARIRGVFVRLCQRDEDPRYLIFIPRVLRQFQTAVTDTGLTEVATFLNDALPD